MPLTCHFLKPDTKDLLWKLPDQGRKRHGCSYSSTVETYSIMKGDFLKKKQYNYYMTRTFDSWYEYDTWLTSPSSDVEKAPGNYNVFTITKIEEVDGKIVVEMEEKKS